MMQGIALTGFLALAGLLPLAVFAAMAACEGGLEAPGQVAAAIRRRDVPAMQRAGQQMIFAGIFVGVAPDIFVILDPASRWLFYPIDRACDMLSAPILIMGALLWRSSRAANPVVGMKIWGGALAVCIAAALAMVWAA